MDSQPKRLSLRSVSTLRWSIRSSQSTLTANSLAEEPSTDKGKSRSPPPFDKSRPWTEKDVSNAEGKLSGESAPWDELFRRRASPSLPPQASVRTYRDGGIAVIEGKGRIVGRVASLSPIDKDEILSVHWKCKSGPRGRLSECVVSVPKDEDTVKIGDLIFIIDGAAAAMVVRIRKDYAEVVRTAVDLPRIGKGLGPSYSMVIIWRCMGVSGATRNEAGEEEYFDEISLPAAFSRAGSEAVSDKNTRLFNVGLLLRDIQEDGAARERLWEAFRSFDQGPEGGSTQRSKTLLPKRWMNGKTHAASLVDLLMQHMDGTPALRYAARHGLEIAVRLILASGNAHFDGAKRKSPFALAAKRGHWSTARLFLAMEGEEIQRMQPTVLRSGHAWELGDAEEEGLICAVIQSDRQTIEILLDIGTVNLDSRDEGGRTALIWAVRMKNHDAVSLLLDTGRANPGVKDDYGLTPLIWAALLEDSLCSQRLLKAKRERSWWRQRHKVQPTYRDMSEYALFS